MSMGKKSRRNGQKMNMSMDDNMRLFRRRFLELRKDAKKLYEDYGEHTAITLIAPDGSKHAIGFPSVEAALSLSKEGDQERKDDTIAMFFSPSDNGVDTYNSSQSLKEVREKMEAIVLDIENEPSCSTSTAYKSRR